MTPDQLKELERLNERWANPESFKHDAMITHAVMDLLPDVIAHIKQLAAERDAALKACAQKDEALQFCSQFPLGEDLHYKVCAALDDNTCGKGWLSPEQANEYRTGVMRELRRIAREEWKPVVKALAQTLEHLNIMLDIDGRPLDSNDRDVINDAQAALAHAERITGDKQ